MFRATHKRYDLKSSNVSIRLMMFVSSEKSFKYFTRQFQVDNRRRKQNFQLNILGHIQRMFKRCRGSLRPVTSLYWARPHQCGHAIWHALERR